MQKWYSNDKTFVACKSTLLTYRPTTVKISVSYKAILLSQAPVETLYV